MSCTGMSRAFFRMDAGHCMKIFFLNLNKKIQKQLVIWGDSNYFIPCRLPKCPFSGKGDLLLKGKALF